MVKIGLALADSKAKLMNFPENIKAIFNDEPVHWLKYDHKRPQLSQNGPFDMIIQKIYDIPTKHHVTEEETQLMLEEAEKYHTVILDCMENMNLCQDRGRCMKLIEENSFEKNQIKVLCPNYFVCSPELSFDDLKVLMERKGIQFPIVVKPNLIYEENDTMYLYLKKTDESLNHLHNQIKKFESTIIQEFIDHEGIIFKLGIIGRNWHISRRTSLKNHKEILLDNCDFISFQSCKISKNESDSHLIDRSKLEMNAKLDCDVVKELVLLLNGKLGFKLLGVDIIRDSNSGHYIIIDLNYFTSFRDIPRRTEFFTTLIEQSLSDNQLHS